MNPTPTDPSLGLRDIKPALDIPQPAAGWPLWATLLLAGLALAATFGVWWFVRRCRVTSVPTAAEIALQRLAGLLDTETDSQRYAIGVSDTLRQFIESRHGLAATHQTTEEFLLAVSERGLGTSDDGVIGNSHRSVLREFLCQCDEVKFARGELDAAQRLSLHDVAHAFVQTSSEEDAVELVTHRAALQPSPQT